jgi:hypothetical protein
VDAWAVETSEHERLRALIRPLLPDGSAPIPGCELGPLQGHAAGRYPNFVWARWHTLAVDEITAVRLQAGGLGIPAFVPAQLRVRSNHPPRLVELEVRPAIELAAEAWQNREPDWCPVCGGPRGKSTGLILRGDTQRPGLDLFRPRWAWTKILATPRFKEFVEDAGLTGLEFTEVEVV